MELILIAGIATAFNFIIIIWKFNNGRTIDGTLDLGGFIAISTLFSGTMSGMAAGMVASAILSLYLLISPPKFAF